MNPDFYVRTYVKLTNIQKYAACSSRGKQPELSTLVAGHSYHLFGP